MKLLILTQKVDINDDVLGFFHGWIKKLAEHFENIIVICLEKGEHNLPANVRVLSLGKESMRIAHYERAHANICNSHYWHKICILASFYKYIWQERKNYDSVFVHMNQEYVILGWKFWKLFGKRISLWRNHPKGGLWCRIAVLLSNNVFCTSQFAFVAKCKKTKIMPAGIDTECFKFQVPSFKIKDSILYLGRISPIKNVDILIEALNLLKNKNINFKAKIIGDAPERDRGYYENIKQKTKEYNLENYVDFEKGVSNYKSPEIYKQYEIFVNLTPSGSLDKTIFEAMACGNLVLVSNRSLSGQIDKRLFFKEKDTEDLAAKLEKILFLDASAKENIIKSSRDFVVQKHSLNLLIKKLLEEF